MTPNIDNSIGTEKVVGFDALSDLAYKEAGLVLVEAKASMIQSRLRHRLKDLNIPNLSDYCDYVNSDSSGGEKRLMISALTTNVSDFFREPHHFDLMKEKAAPVLMKRKKNKQPIRVWSAGCSNGQEPYSIAMFLLELDPSLESYDCKILATDIDTNVLSFAADGSYSESQMSGVSLERRTRFFSPGGSGEDDKYQVNSSLKSMISFKQLNLISNWPMRKQFDVIFCRNVVIYFDATTQDSLWPKFSELLRDDGLMFVGHSERISCSRFQSVGATAYQKCLATAMNSHS